MDRLTGVPFIFAQKRWIASMENDYSFRYGPRCVTLLHKKMEIYESPESPTP